MAKYYCEKCEEYVPHAEVTRFVRGINTGYFHEECSFGMGEVTIEDDPFYDG